MTISLVGGVLPSLEGEQLIEALYDENVTYYCIVCSIILTFYEFAITFTNEVKCIWKRKFSIVTFLFLINRYVLLFRQVLMILHILPWQRSNGAEICMITTRMAQALTIISEITFAVFMALRLYAIWSNRIRIASLVLFLGLIVPAADIYYYSTLTITAASPPLSGCIEIASMGRSDFLAFNVLLRVTSIMADGVVLGLTWYKTLSVVRNLRNLGVEAPLSMTLLRDGTVYFISLLILNILSLAGALQHNVLVGQELPIFNSVITPIIMSRFMLNLRNVFARACEASEKQDTMNSNGSYVSSVSFAGSSIIGNLGASLAVDQSVADEQEVGVEEDDEVSWTHDPLGDELSYPYEAGAFTPRPLAGPSGVTRWCDHV